MNPTSAEQPSSPSSDASLGALGRVLVVDDEAPLRRVWERCLTRAGYTVEVAADGDAASQLLSRHVFDAVLSDISMPRFDGMQLLELVHERHPDLPLVLMTGNPSLQTAMRAVEHGAVRYLAKPASSAVVLETIAHACETGRDARARRRALAQQGKVALASEARATLEQGFERALGSLWMAYQPIVRWSTQSTIAYEALLRTTDAAFPNPGVMLCAAETLERLPDLGSAIRAHVARTIATLPSGGDIFVNLHSMDLADAALYAGDAPLSTHASRVVLEVTERAKLEDLEATTARVAALRARGFRIAVDDLGAGYAGLTTFALLSPEVVKLDMSLIRDVDRTPIKQHVVRSINALCAQMDMMVVAEGVETIAERDMLISLGCDVFQGYLFGRPSRPFTPANF